MKLLNKSTIAAIAFASVFTFGNAIAKDTANMPLTSINGVTGAHLRVSVEDGVATLFGTVDSGVDAGLAIAHVAKMEGITEVSSYIVVN